ncbi:putative ribonuclease H-like domain-containing protein, partial [Tanacetum coccineum]
MADYSYGRGIEYSKPNYNYGGNNWIGWEGCFFGMHNVESFYECVGASVTSVKLQGGFVAVEIPFTPRAKRVLELSLEEAPPTWYRHNYIGSEHLMLGSLREGEGVAARVLENLGADPKTFACMSQLDEFAYDIYPIISLGQKNTLAEYMILSGANNRPSMLDKDLYDSWKIEENGVIRTKKYVELSAAEKIQSECDMKATNIILQGLPVDIYSLVNHHRVAKDLWERVQLLMQGFDVPVFSSGDDLIACLNKAMAFLTVVASLRFPTTNNQLRTFSNPRNQATIQDGKVTVQQIQGIQGQNYSGNTYKNNATSSRGNNTSGQARVVKCYNCQGEGHMARQCTQPKQPRNAAWYKEKTMLAEAQEAGQILDEEQLAFLADPGIPSSQAQTVIPHNAAFQTENIDTYDSDCNDLSTAQAVLMANISNYGSDVILEVPNSETYLNDMDNQSVHALQDFEQSSVMDFTDNEISSDSNIIPY